jgi:hypothetical protein
MGTGTEAIANRGRNDNEKGDSRFRELKIFAENACARNHFISRNGPWRRNRLLIVE